MNLSYGEAMREALFMELHENQDTIMFGQDIEHNLYGYTKDLKNIYGAMRIKDTPLSEAAVVGTGIGAAMCGIRTIIDLTVSNFLYVAMDQIVNMAAKTIYMYDGQFRLPLTIMCSSMYKCGNGAQHSDRPHPMFMNVPGLKIATPSTPQDAYSLLRSSINDNSPVIYFSDRTLFYDKADVNLDLQIGLGKANIISQGKNLTLIAISGSLSIALATANELKTVNDISIELIDVRTLAPLDRATILQSVIKTGRVVIVDTAHKTCSAASEISSIIAEEAFEYLKSPIGIVSYEDCPIPFSNELEVILAPSKEKLLNKILFTLNFGKKS